MSNPVKIIATLVAKPGNADALRALLDDLVAASRTEPGNLRYDLWQDSADPNRFVVDELYRDDAAVAAHRASPHFQTYGPKIGDLAELGLLVLNPVALA
ncbi:putative quinol monooxygenase [Segnochrobactrum spirostomi]|uniref:Antibiotic biosynthesis monooxygenase n=1 Tax=Segnochrobactrum spirostomi TaxID=2608987 RepID=A0A6A7Y1P9_9HYPH|nr:putative quinol monooxygenase [Segnochrobactrum spirostomi]MQT12934.1 antibiotic biosynthesis monooxygenase [Segnochrobactrum spirostomi]